MANSFKNYTATAGNTATTCYTVPASTQAVVIGLTASNIDTATINVTIMAANTSLITGVPIPVGSTLSALDGKLVLEAADTITVESDQPDSVDVLVSVLEIS